jgi:ADP-ribose pyrophosphatase
MMNDHGANTEPTAETTIVTDDVRTNPLARFLFGKPTTKIWRHVVGAKEHAEMVLRVNSQGVSELSYYVKHYLVRQLDVHEATLDDAQRTQFDKWFGGPLPTLVATDQPGWHTRSDLTAVAQVAALPYDPRPMFIRARNLNELDVFYYDNAMHRWGIFVDTTVQPATFQAWNTTLPSPPGYTRCSIGVSHWGTDDPNYRPETYTASVVRANEGVWADKDRLSPKEMDEKVSYAIFDDYNLYSMQSYPHRDASGRWLCPFGRTGMAGRGVLGQWGPNHAADPIITRTVARDAIDTPVVQVLLITRNDDTRQLAFPGGMVDAGEIVRETLKRELCEEALCENEVVHRLFSEGERGLVYCGPVMDWRTTDHAWIETTAMHFHATGDVAQGLELHITDTREVSKVAWYDIDTVDPAAMFASHGDWLCKVRKSLDAPDVPTTSSSQAARLEIHSASSCPECATSSKKRAAPDDMNVEGDHEEAKCDKRHCAQQIEKKNGHKKEASLPNTEQLCVDLDCALMQFSPKAIGVDLDFRGRLCELLARTFVRVAGLTYRHDAVASACTRLLMIALNADGVPESSTALAD